MAIEVIQLTPQGKKFWNTHKAKLRVIVTDKPVRTYGGYWSGGSRNEWWAQTKNGTTNPLPVKTDPFDSRPDPEYPVSQDIAVVMGGVCNGKTASLSVYVTRKEGWTW
jgi:hypothetical protein